MLLFNGTIFLRKFDLVLRTSFFIWKKNPKPKKHAKFVFKKTCFLKQKSVLSNKRCQLTFLVREYWNKLLLFRVYLKLNESQPKNFL